MKKRIYTIIGFFFLQGLLHNIGHPITPSFVRGLLIEDYMFGVFFSAMSLGLMIGGPIWGILGDRGKKKLYIVFGLTLYSIGQLVFGFSGNQFLMVLFRFIAGFGVVASGTIMMSQIIMYAKVESRAKYLAYAVASTSLGASVGYFLGGFLSQNPLMIQWFQTSDLRNIFLIQAILNMFYVILIMFSFKENEEQASFDIKKPTLLQGLKEITKVEKSLLIFLISLTLITIGGINLSRYIDVYFDELGYNPQQLGTYVMVTGIVSLVASIFIVPIFAKVKKQLLLIAVTNLVAALIIFIVFRSTPFIVYMYTLYLVYVVIKTTYTPLEQSYIAAHVKDGKYGQIVGLRQSFLSFGMVIGPLIGGVIYNQNALWLFDFSAISFIIGVVLLGFVYTLKKKEAKLKV